MNRSAALGASGEAIAERHLEAKGYISVGRNWHCRAGEIDLIMLDGDVLVFVEVKLRRTRTAGAAEEAVSANKASRLLAAGDWFVAEHAEHADRFWRIDVVAITMGQRSEPERVTHVQNAVTFG
ncbi:MAG: YraN family protein [Thermomicrobiales bacterium]